MNRNDIRHAVGEYLGQHDLSGMNLRAAMFDMDGVLFDSMKNHTRSWYETMQHFGFTDFCVDEAYMHEGRTGAGTINIVSQRMRGHDASEEEIEAIYRYKTETFNALPRAGRMPGSHELLQKVCASGVMPLIVTGSGQNSLLDRLNTNFPGIFARERMVTAFDVKYGKPNPEPYLMGMKKAQDAIGEVLSLENFIVVENAPLGVRAGVAAGCFTIAVNTGPLPDDVLLGEGANLLFHSMQEFCEEWEQVYSALTPDVL